jgi:hypothetical protein
VTQANLAVDATTAATPFRFWLNDCDDISQGAPAGKETVDSQTVDWKQHQIVTEYNLQNFTRLWINMTGTLDTLNAQGNNLQIGLKWKNTNGTSPAINLYLSADPAGSLSYLASDTAALAQIAEKFNNAITSTSGNQTVDTSGTFILPARAKAKGSCLDS